MSKASMKLHSVAIKVFGQKLARHSCGFQPLIGMYFKEKKMMTNLKLSF
jgi:hypothetical protein